MNRLDGYIVLDVRIPQNIMDHLEKWFNAGYGLLPRPVRRAAVEPVIVGHRGVCGHPDLKENTLEAFDLAIELGGGIELDLQLSADGIPIVSHDPDLGRIHGVDRVIADSTSKELKSVAPGVPTLDEVFKRYGKRCPHYFLESKVYQPAEKAAELISKIRALVNDHGLMKHVTLISLDARPLDQARIVFPELPKAYIFSIDPKEAVDYALSHQDTGVAGWYFSYPGRIRKFLAENNLHEGVGHIDYKNTMKACSNRGFRYQFTNRIDRVKGSMEMKGSSGQV
jgi:glycerophosphoryl diester phosphodiesterase